MTDKLPSVTVIIAARPVQSKIQALAGSSALEYPAEKLEVIIARGTQPSAQRNAALKAAHGELIYFLDDDSVSQPGNLARAVPHFARPEVMMVGGPNLCPPDAPPLEHVFALVLASWAFGPSRARYAGVGQLRETSEKELILCNLMARREAMLQLGGFNEALYPNEENALMDELQKRGGKLLYDPDFFVFRRPRASLRAFVRMLMTYGRGRAEQFRLHPSIGSALNFAPPAFCAYIVALIPALVLLPQWAGILLAPLGLYTLLVVAQGIGLMIRNPQSNASGATRQPAGLGLRMVRGLAAMPLVALVFPLYGLGFWRGLFTKLTSGARKTPVEVVLETRPPQPVPTE